jgi:hypothetical protein
VTLILPGHLHVFQALNFDLDLPPQMIVGHSGTLLDQGTPPDPAGLAIGEVTVTSGMSTPGLFGLLFSREICRGEGLRTTTSMAFPSAAVTS